MTGVTVVLYTKTLSSYDSMNNPVYTTKATNVENVLVGQPETDDVTSSISLYGKRIAYWLGLPKGDSHVWTDSEVEIFGEKFRTFGDTVQGIEANVPTPWHKKVRVERCE